MPPSQLGGFFLKKRSFVFFLSDNLFWKCLTLCNGKVTPLQRFWWETSGVHYRKIPFIRPPPAHAGGALKKLFSEMLQNFFEVFETCLNIV